MHIIICEYVCMLLLGLYQRRAIILQDQPTWRNFTNRQNVYQNIARVAHLCRKTSHSVSRANLGKAQHECWPEARLVLSGTKEYPASLQAHHNEPVARIQGFIRD